MGKIGCSLLSFVEDEMEFELLKLGYPEKNIGTITFNRPNKLNAFSQRFFVELEEAVEEMDENDDVIVVIVKANGRAFSAGLDFYDFFRNLEDRRVSGNLEEFLHENVRFMQKSISSIERSSKIFIAAIHGYCVGGGLDLASTCDIRFASSDAIFSIMETKVGVVADLGSIQRLPRIIGESNTRLLAYTAMKINAEIAGRMGLVSFIYKDKKELFKGALEFAREIVSNPKEAVLGTKKALNYGIAHSVEESLDFTARYNSRIFDYEATKFLFEKNVG